MHQVLPQAVRVVARERGQFSQLGIGLVVAGQMRLLYVARAADGY
jgi:hypothetical protein